MNHRQVILAGVIQMLCCAPLSAHHPLTGYKLDQPLTLEGTLSVIELSNQHSLLMLDVAAHADLR